MIYKIKNSFVIKNIEMFEKEIHKSHNLSSNT